MFKKFDDFNTKSINNYGIALIGKAGVGKTTLMKLLQFDETIKPSSSILQGTTNFYDETISIKKNEKELNLTITDTVGFKGNDKDNQLAENMVNHLRKNCPRLNVMIIMVARHRLDDVDESILELIYKVFYDNLKSRLLIIVTHCSEKAVPVVKPEIENYHKMFKEIKTLFIDAPDPESIDDELVEFYLQKWQKYRQMIVEEIIANYNDPISIGDLFEDQRIEKFKKELENLRLTVENQKEEINSLKKKKCIVQ